jgi:hypothetical protein
MYGGHLSADPNITLAATTDITPHLYFFMVKNRRTADKERVVFWFNVSSSALLVWLNTVFRNLRSLGWSRVLILRRRDDGGWPMAVGRQVGPRLLRQRGRLGGIYHHGVWYVIYDFLSWRSPNIKRS